MSSRRCRAKTFYVSPKEKLSFAQSELHALVGSDLIRVSHRGDIKRLEETNPSWDGLCAVVDKAYSSATPKDFQTAAQQERVSFCYLDSRVVEGRPPKGLQRALHQLSCGELDSVGLKALCQDNIKDSQVSGWVAVHVESLPSSADQAHYLRFMLAASSLLDRSSAMKLADVAHSYRTSFPAVFWSSTSLVMSGFENFPLEHRVDVLTHLWKKTQEDHASAMLDAAVQKFVNYQSSTWIDLIVADAARHENIWVEVVANWVGDRDYRSVLHMFDFPASFLNKVASRPGALPAVAAHRNGSAAHMAKLVSRRGWTHLLLPHLPVLSLDDNKADILARALQDIPTPKSVGEHQFQMDAHAALAQHNPVYAPRLADTISTWLTEVTSAPENEVHDCPKWLKEATVDFDQDTLAVLRKTLTFKDDSLKTKYDNAVASLILRSPQVGFKFHKRLSQVTDMPPVSDWDISQWHPDDRLQKYHELPREYQTSAARKLLTQAVSSKTMSQSSFLDFVHELHLPPQQTRSAAALWKVVRENKGMDEAVWDTLTGSFFFCEFDVVSVISDLEDPLTCPLPDIHKVNRYMDLEDYAALSLSGQTTVVPTNPGNDPAVFLANQVLSARLCDVPWPENVQSASEFPTPSDQPWVLDENVCSQVHGAKVALPVYGELDVEVLPDIISLRNNAREMRNCTAGYSSDVASGKCIMLALKANGSTELNVSLFKSATGWEVTEVDSWANAGVPEGLFPQLKEQLGALLQASSVQSQVG